MCWARGRPLEKSYFSLCVGREVVEDLRSSLQLSDAQNLALQVSGRYSTEHPSSFRGVERRQETGDVRQETGDVGGET